jgi:small subunit ribosomal protein S6
MPFYESTFIVRQDVPAQQVETLAATLGQLVTDQGGTVIKTEQWGLKSLSYRVKKNRKGHYVMLGLEAPSAAVSELERNLRINEDVLRYLTVRVEKLDAQPSAMLQAKHGREERHGRDDRFGREDRFGRDDRFGGRGREDRFGGRGRERREETAEAVAPAAEDKGESA